MNIKQMSKVLGIPASTLYTKRNNQPEQFKAIYIGAECIKSNIAPADVANFKKSRCENCKHFEVDEGIDPNMHFGYCTEDRGTISGIITIDFFCGNFEEKK